MKNQKGQALLVIVLIVAIFAVVGFTLYTQRMHSLQMANMLQTPYPYQAQQVPLQVVATPTPVPINNISDLNNATVGLDSTNTNQIDTQLNSLNSASSGF